MPLDAIWCIALISQPIADVMKLVDMLVLEASGVTRVGSSPTVRTNQPNLIVIIQKPSPWEPSSLAIP
ncbi:MAG: hypothetical protein RL011_403 [Pseudomonadota bacterium]